MGDNPLDHIDWIIENGLDMFTYWYRCYEMGTIYTPATVQEYSENKFEICEGKGNKVIYRLNGICEE